MSTAWGNARAHLLYKGVELPPRGSVRDELLKEVFWRERNEQLATVGLISRVIARGLGVPLDEIQGMLSDYTDIVTQHRYTPAVAGKLRREKLAQAQQQADDTRKLQKVDKLTVKDEELTPPPSPQRGKRRKRRG